MTSYYNDAEPYVAAWLENLIDAGELPEGTVDRRSIAEVRPADLDGFDECHFFAGIGGWPYAIGLAGWPDNRLVWTGSCPCQPFSQAGKHRGTDDERHLWPEFLRLIAERRPPTIFGEQVASRAGREWLAGVRADLEALGYAVGAADLCAASANAPHIRQRLFWVAYPSRERSSIRPGRGDRGSIEQRRPKPYDDSATGWLAESDQRGRREERKDPGGRGEGSDPTWLGERSGRGVALGDDRMGDPSGARLPIGVESDRRTGSFERATFIAPGSLPGYWSRAEWLPCLDGKSRRVEPGVFPLAHGVPGRVGRLRAYGNAIVPQLAAIFIRSVMQACHIEPNP